jgi:hypothetical protein
VLGPAPVSVRLAGTYAIEVWGMSFQEADMSSSADSSARQAKRPNERLWTSSRAGGGKESYVASKSGVKSS